MKNIDINNFEKLCLIEQERVYKNDKETSWLFWINNKNELQCDILLNLLGVDFKKNNTFNKINYTQKRDDFKMWILQEHQKFLYN
jgi:hypothetical protein